MPLLTIAAGWCSSIRIHAVAIHVVFGWTAAIILLIATTEVGRRLLLLLWWRWLMRWWALRHWHRTRYGWSPRWRHIPVTDRWWRWTIAMMVHGWYARCRRLHVRRTAPLITMPLWSTGWWWRRCIPAVLSRRISVPAIHLWRRRLLIIRLHGRRWPPIIVVWWRGSHWWWRWLMLIRRHLLRRRYLGTVTSWGHVGFGWRLLLRRHLVAIGCSALNISVFLFQIVNRLFYVHQHIFNRVLPLNCDDRKSVIKGIY